MDRPLKVAVIGGGCASLTAAFELTRPEHQGRYQVTVYQQGWRLGGKGASGRGLHDRIEEHGLHLWMGYYENAFRILRDCYEELGRDPEQCPIADWRDAFFPDPAIGLADPNRDGSWHTWLAQFPPGAGVPGDPLDHRSPFTLSSYLRRTAALLETLLTSAQDLKQESPQTHDPFRGGQRQATDPAAILLAVRRILGYSQLATTATLIEAVRVLELACGAMSRAPLGDLLKLVEQIATGFRKLLAEQLERDVEVRRLWTMADLLLTIFRGILRFDLINDPRGLDAIDDYELKDWLRLNGASDLTLRSTFVRSLYDLCFAYEDGDPEKPCVAAGALLRGMFRMFFTYRGSVFWKMRAGMGDIVFAPTYEALKKRGVEFKFFHRLENVRLATNLEPGERAYVEALELAVQAQTRDGGEYQPLIDVNGLPCWPSEPDWDQLQDGEEARNEKRHYESPWEKRGVCEQTLHVGEDFDFVVLGTSLGTLPHVCREIVQRDERWQTMLDKMRTVATQSFQLWLHEDAQTLGWPHGESVNFTGFVEPFDTWADMPQLIDAENFPVKPRSIGYFCNAFDAPTAHDEETLRRQRDQVRENAIRFLENDMPHIWPRSVDGGGFRWELLADGGPMSTREETEQRFDTQYWIANVAPSERYVLSIPGSSKFRLSPLDNTYDNLTIAGDWTSCGLNYGCVEAATISGRLAAHALSGFPALEDIPGYDHP